MEAYRRSLPFVFALACGIPAAPGYARPSAPSAVVIAVPRRPVAIVVLPAVHRVVTADTAGMLTTFDPSLRRLASFRVCARPRWLVGDDRDGRVLVGCAGATAAPDDDRGELAVVDVVARTVLARLPGIATLTVAGIDASPHRLAYVRRSDGKVARFDPVSGRVADAIALDDDTGDPLRFVAGDARTPMIVVDRYADRVFAIESTGAPIAIALGRRRYPADAVLDGRRLIVALSGAGTVDSIDLDRPDDHRIVPAVDTPVAVALGRERQILTVGRRSSESDDIAVVALSERAAARVVRIIPAGHAQPGSFDMSAMGLEPVTVTVIDPVTARLVVAAGERVDVVDTAGGSFSFDVRAGMSVTGLALDAASGDAYVAAGDTWRGGALARIPVRGERPRIPATADEVLRRSGEFSAGTTVGVFENDDGAADPPGRRSPAQLVARADGSLIVADVLSPTLGTFSAGAYREEPVASSAVPRMLALDRDGTLWFSETTPTDRGAVARRAPDGRIAEFSLPALVKKIVVADDGLYWFGGYPHQLLGRVTRDGTITMRSDTLRGPGAAGRDLVDVAPAPGGGCYALYEDGLVLVAPDGTTRVFPEFPAALRLKAASAVAALTDGSVAVAAGRVIVRFERTGARRILRPTAPGADSDLTSASPRCRISELAAGPEGSLWAICGERIVRVERSGKVRVVEPPVPQSMPQSLVQTRDGSMWFAEPRHSALGRIAPDGALTEFAL